MFCHCERSEAISRRTLTRLAALGTLSRNAGEGLDTAAFLTLSRTAGEGGPLATASGG